MLHNGKMKLDKKILLSKAKDKTITIRFYFRGGFRIEIDIVEKEK